MDNRQLTEKESIALIADMIGRTKDRYIGNGNIMLMWGYLTVAVTALVWVLLYYTHDPRVNYLWFLLWIIGGIATPLMDRKCRRSSGVKNYSDRVTSQMWTAAGIAGLAATAMCVVFSLMGIAGTFATMFAFALVIVPFAEIVSGIMVREKSLTVGGGVGLAIGLFTLCCISGRVTLYADWYLPLFMLAFVAMMIIPGHIINSKTRKNA